MPSPDSGLLSLAPDVLFRVVQQLKFKDLFKLLATCKTLRRGINSDPKIWASSLRDSGLWFGDGSEESFQRALSIRIRNLNRCESNGDPAIESLHSAHPHPYKLLFISCSLTRSRWITNSDPAHTSIYTGGNAVLTCLALSEGQVIAAFDDFSINVYSLSSGEHLHTLKGHSGGVWCLGVVKDFLVSGSTDRTLRIQTGKCRFTFSGHTGTVRSLSLVKPEILPILQEDGSTILERWPKEPLIVTGSRDNTLRIWEIPGEKNGEFHDDERGDACKDGITYRSL